MKIDKVEIKNFRCLKSVELPFDNLTVLVGRNGSGKSSFIHAIRILFTPKANITIEDFYNRDIKTPIEIRATFSDFTNEEKKEFKSYIQDDKMIIIKTITYVKETARFSQEYFSYKAQIRKFVEIREITGSREKTNAFNELVDEELFPDFNERSRSVANTLSIMEKYEEEHQELCELIRIKPHFFGARNVGGGKLDKYTKFIYLPAVKEASDEIEGKNSSFDQLLQVTVLRDIANRSDLISFREEITERIVDRFSPKSLGGLEKTSNRISERLDLYSPGAALVLNWNEVEPPQIDLPSVRCDVIEDGYEGVVTKKGQGLQRALILTLLEYLSHISAIDELEEDEEKKVPIRIDTILAIEEPEIYLHPTRARYLSIVLWKLAENGGEVVTQIVYTTHSPYFVGLDRFDGIRVCRKIGNNGNPPCTSNNGFDLVSANERLEELCGSSVSLQDPRENFRLRAASVMKTTVNEGFFSDFVVLVEGRSDAVILWKVQEQLNENWDQRSISLIPVEGKSNLIKPKIVFDGLHIPNYVLFDKDESNSRKNRIMMKLVGVNSDELPSEKIHDSWAYNAVKMEDELEKMLTTTIYEEIWEDVEIKLQCKDERYDWIRTNLEALALFVECIYERGLSLPHYENIVLKIEAYYKLMV